MLITIISLVVSFLVIAVIFVIVSRHLKSSVVGKTIHTKIWHECGNPKATCKVIDVDDKCGMVRIEISSTKEVVDIDVETFLELWELSCQSESLQ